MKERTALTVTQDLFLLMKRLPRLRARPGAIHGLTRSEYEFLVTLATNINGDKAAFSVSEMSSLLWITPAAVTHLINPLEAAGYIERRPDPRDRRIVLIGLTGKGARVAKILIEEIEVNLGGLVNHLGEEDSQTLIRLVSRAIDYFTAMFAVENDRRA